MSRADEPTIVDVIAVPWHYDPKQIHYYVVVDRAIEYVYSRQPNDEHSVYTLGQRHVGCRFTGKDGPFYNFLAGTGNKGHAFAGREFDIQLDDGTKFHCQGDVWSCCQPPGMDTVDVGVASQAQLDECYVFFGGHVERSVLNAWLATNEPKTDYSSRDPKEPARKAAREKCAVEEAALREKQATCVHNYEEVEDAVVNEYDEEITVAFKRCKACGHETEAVVPT